MRNRLESFSRVAGYLGSIHIFFGFVFAVPVASAFLLDVSDVGDSVMAFAVPAALSMALGLLLKRLFRAGPPKDAKEAALLCALGWLSVSAIGAVPFVMRLRIGYLDAYFETMSGFTTTGITMLSGLDSMDKSLLLWRAFTQWLGGLGILALFLAFMFSGAAAHRIFTAESHKILSRRPVPGLFSTLRTLWAIYSLLTAACVLVLRFEGLSLFDAVCHAFTALSTGGYSTHDASVDFYRQAGYANFALIEYTLVVFMLLGGINFLVHFRLLRGDWRAVWDSFEIRLFWLILAASTAIVTVEYMLRNPGVSPEAGFRCSLFQTASIFTTTGFATKDIGSGFFGAAAKQIFLMLMVVGGCVGSTGGGVKVLRVGILLKMLKRQVMKIIRPRSARVIAVLDGAALEDEECRRVGALFFAWFLFLFLGGLVTAAFSSLGALESASGMFSALGNIGPCYISDMASLHPIVKVTYILGMLAGRLEILPVMLLFSRKAWC